MPDENQTPEGRQDNTPAPDDNIEVVGTSDAAPQGEEQEAPAEEESQASDDASKDDGQNTSESAEEAPSKPKSKGVQKRIDELTSARRDAERDRDYWRELAMREKQSGEAPANGGASPEPKGPEAPDPKSFQDGEFDPRYIEALADYRADMKVSERFEAEAKRREVEKAQAKAMEARNTFSERATAAGETGEKALELTRDPDARVTPVMAEVILSSEMGVEIAAHLQANREDLDRIASLPPTRQAYEMGLIQAQYIASDRKEEPAPLQEKPAPKATPTVTGRTGTGVSKPLEAMTQAEYEAETNKRARSSNSGWV